MHRDVAGVAQGSPKSGTHGVEMIRVLKVAKDSAMKARTQATNQMMALVLTALAGSDRPSTGSRPTGSSAAALVSGRVTW